MPKTVTVFADTPIFIKNLQNGVIKAVTGALIDRLNIVAHRRLYLVSGSIPTLNSGFQIAIVGPDSTKIANDFNLVSVELENSDALLFQASTSGISESDATLWSKARDLYIPSIVLITDFNDGEIDFDDMALIAGRILDPLITPYLVLHDDSGQPVALIELETLSIFDYSTGVRELLNSEPEHKELVSEFASEFAAKVEEFGPTGFQDALLFPAIPYYSKLSMGKIETLEYLKQLPTRS